MSTPYPKPKPNENTGMRRIHKTSSVDESIKARLPQAGSGIPPSEPPPPSTVYAAPPPEYRPVPWSSRFLPAFWTIASVISLVVNVILFALLLIAFRMLGEYRTTANDQVSGLLGGLYQNFVRMEEANITRNIPVDANIPLNITVPVQGATRITLATDTVIPNAHVFISEGGITINARARVTLPADTALNVNIDRFDLPVQNTIPVHLDVPVNIPLRETQLREPFQGLQQVVRPWYCLVEPNAFLNGQQVCPPSTNPPAIGTVTP